MNKFPKSIIDIILELGGTILADVTIYADPYPKSKTGIGKILSTIFKR